MKSISIDNGHSTTTPAKAIKAVGIEVIAQMMDDETREHVAPAAAGFFEIVRSLCRHHTAYPVMAENIGKQD